ncbi:MAG TPA: beta-galactosidase, partial [Bacteroidota bacterium]
VADLVIALASFLSLASSEPRLSVRDLTGMWHFRMDPRDAGVGERWFLQRLEDTVHLPGSMAENRRGEPVTIDTKWVGGIVDRSWFTEERYAPYRKPGNIKLPFWLTPASVYQGVAWYQRDIDIPAGWSGSRIVLSLERAHWETRVWIDSAAAGMRNSLAVPHEYDVTDFMLPGRHTITIRVDNRIREIDIGRNAHSITDHTQTDWNGIVGRIELRSGSPVYIEDLSVFPDASARVFTIVARLRNTTGRPQRGELTFRAVLAGSGKGRLVTTRQSIPADTLTVMNWYPVEEDSLLWDEFHPNLYEISVGWNGEDPVLQDERRVISGLRDFRVSGTGFTINGRRLFLRGTLDWVLFPLTGYPSTLEKDWDHLFDAVRAYGMNHVRFHSWCPPEAAFSSADRHGLYLQVECGAWCTVGEGGAVDGWLYDESKRIVLAFGNHPSFCMMAYGNEPSGRNMNRYLGDFVSYWKHRDSRRVYTAGAGWPVIPESDYLSIDKARIQVWGMGLTSIINRDPPSTRFDFRDTVSRYDRPLVAHETGQWCAYPDFREIPRYTGVLRAGNYEIVRDDLESKRMGNLDSLFVQASGKLQVLCYKADIEAALRTPGLAGFQLLGLHDFPGQGTAPVGVLNVFSESKGYIRPEEFREFCSPTVPLVRIDRLIFLNTQKFSADLEVAHFGDAPMHACMPGWTVTGPGGVLIASGNCPRRDIPRGSGIPLGHAGFSLKNFHAPGEYLFTLNVGSSKNSWRFWVYPAQVPAAGDSGLLVTQTLDRHAASFLEKGGRVLLTLRKGSVRPGRGGDIALGFSTIFWNTAWTRGQAPHTLGILCDPDHPAFASFPTSFHTDFQWWDALTNAQAMIIDSLPGIVPLIRVIDDWNRNRPLALAFEARVGRGTLIVCSIDLLTDMEKRPEARQLLYSLSSYECSPRFRPAGVAEIASVRAILADHHEGGDN